MSDSFKMGVERSEDYELFHYGVKGMKWGVRRPVDSATGLIKKSSEARKERRTARREAKAQKFEGKAKGYRDRIDNLMNTPMSEVKISGSNKRLIRKLEKQEARSLKDAGRAREGKLTSGQRKAIAGAAVATAIVASAVGLTAAAYYDETGQLNSAILKGKEFIHGKQFGPFERKNKFANAAFTPDEVLDNVVKGINPHYKELGGQMNCRRNTIAYELRRRGFDVTATPSSLGYGQSETGLVNALTPGKQNINATDSIMRMVSRGKGITGRVSGDDRSFIASRVKVDNPRDHNNLLKAFSNQPSGARGEILFDFGSFGHSMAYEIFDGKPVIFDSQKAKKYNVDEFDIEAMAAKWGTPKVASVTRLDDVPMDMDFVTRWATNTKR